MTSPNFRLNNEEKITLLEELHRPLEEHWSVRTKFGLDPKSSEYIYKHHITRLEDIYTNHKNNQLNAPGLLYMSPVSQLYGINGLNVDNNEKKLKKKEEKWVSNFQKHAFLSDGGVDREKNEVSSRSASPAKTKSFSRSDRKRRGDEADQTKQSNKSARSVCKDSSVSTEDLVMLGLYRFSEEQEEIYRNFVQMISGFDEFDKANIIEDAMKDAQGEEDLLELYGGTALTELPSPTGRPHSAHPHQRSSSQQQQQQQQQQQYQTQGITAAAGANMHTIRPNTADSGRGGRHQ